MENDGSSQNKAIKNVIDEKDIGKYTQDNLRNVDENYSGVIKNLILAMAITCDGEKKKGKIVKKFKPLFNLLTNDRTKKLIIQKIEEVHEEVMKFKRNQEYFPLLL